ncbi:MAG: FprA family A-type flavoprotein [Archaeoglobaceae archaeon]|nr:FprA family A-type flavoprotein [Archaeoglobaceae archaeon]MDW8118157.1 FprA family A-type flavoprotein [Archaeoglobaceae archaeon]
MNPVKIAEDVYWIGALDWSERDFHNFQTPRGLTYNSYLITDEKKVVIDAVKHKFVSEQLQRISKLIDPKEIDYVVVNHIEPDHASGLADLMRFAKNATIICSQKGKEGLCKNFDCKDWKLMVVKNGDTLKIGKRTLMFLDMTMLHWPDSIASYLVEDKILFSNDAFGQHVASEERFAEDLGVDEALKWAKLYYANILMPLATLIKRKLEELKGVEIKLIAPSHGVAWKNPKVIIEQYRKWADFEVENKVVVVYDTMWGSTEKLAIEIADGASKNAKVRLFNTRKDSWTEIVAEILDAKALAVGAPTIHNSLFPPVAGFLSYLKSLKPKNKKALAFGSYGWNGVAVKEIAKTLEELGFETKQFAVKFKPTNEELEKAYDLGVELAK